MWKYLFYIFLAYSLYQLVFKVIIPIYRTTRQVKRGFREMQEKMNAQHAQAQSRPPVDSTNNYARTEEKKAGEYIDFEEVKD
jgi:hypothetical protein